MPQMAMRKDNYTLIGWLPEKTDSISLLDWFATNDPQKLELYDLVVDPSQINDISTQNPEIVDSMKQEMITLWREMRDEGLAGKQKIINN
jgi:arylsulfatase A